MEKCSWCYYTLKEQKTAIAAGRNEGGQIMHSILLLALIMLVSGCSTSRGEQQLTGLDELDTSFSESSIHHPKFEWNCWLAGSTEGEPHIRLGKPENPLSGTSDMFFSIVQVDGGNQPSTYQKQGVADAWLFGVNQEKQWFDYAILILPSGTGSLELSCKRNN